MFSIHGYTLVQRPGSHANRALKIRAITSQALRDQIESEGGLLFLTHGEAESFVAACHGTTVSANADMSDALVMGSMLVYVPALRLMTDLLHPTTVTL